MHVLRDEDSRLRAIKHIEALSLEKPWQVDIKLYRKNRSSAQNRLYWMWLTIVGDDLGYTKKEMHKVFAKKFLPLDVTVAMGETVNDTKSTTDLNTKEFTEYLEEIDIFSSSELGIVLPHPADLYYEAMSNNRTSVTRE